MAIALMVCLFVKMPDIPEIWSDMDAANLNKPQSILGTESYFQRNPLFPCLFLTIACGAISGFHGTQSPLMARCLKNEKMGRPVFYGAMITEGLVALIWATVSMYFFYYGGWREVVDANTVNTFLSQVNVPGGKSLIQYFTAPQVVEHVCTGWLGTFGGLLAIFGVVAAPIPMFLAAIGLLYWQIGDPDGFNTIWNWFGWSNQTLAVFTLWTITIYLVQAHKGFWITLVPAFFMTTVCSTFLFVSGQAFGNYIPQTVGYAIGIGCLIISVVWFAIWYKKFSDNKIQNSNNSSL